LGACCEITGTDLFLTNKSVPVMSVPVIPADYLNPAEADPFKYDQDYVVMLSDWSFESPMAIVNNLKKQAGYYHHQRRTLTRCRLVRSISWASRAEPACWHKVGMLLATEIFERQFGRRRLI